MKTWNLKVKDKILAYILPFVIVALLLVTLLSYTLAKQIFLSNYNYQRQQAESQVVNSLHLADAGYAMLEKELQPQMEQKITEFKQEFAKAGGDPDNISLDALKAKMGGKYDLIIIDSNTTIIKSTIPEGLNFNFMAFDKAIGEKINSVRLSDKIQHERIRTNVGTGYLGMFTYMPSLNHKYVLEIVYSRSGLQKIVEKLDPLSITEQVEKKATDIKSIRIFDAYGYEFVNGGSNYKPTDDILRIVDRTREAKQFVVKSEHITKKYIYVDLKNDSSLGDNSKIIEIVYNNEDILEVLRHISEICFLAGLIITIIMTVIISFLSKKITVPITQLANAAKRLADGEYNVFAKKISRDEVGDLVDIFNSMALKIKEDFDKIEYQKAELEDYNKNLEEKVDERTIELFRAKEMVNREKDILESILEDTLSGYWDWDFIDHRHYFSSGYKKILGYEEFELDNSYETIRQFLFDEDESVIRQSFKKHIESNGKIPFSNEVRYHHKDGSTVWVLFAGHVVEWSSDKKPVEMIGCQINITNRKLLEKSLQEERELLKATLFSMGDGVITADNSGRIEIMNPVAEKLTGWTQEDAQGKLFDEVFRFTCSDPGYKFKNPVEKLLYTKELIHDENQMVLISRDGLERPIEDSVSPIRDEKGNISGVVFVFRDYSEKKERQEKIEYLSLHDQLTGLYNRRFFEEELKRLDTARNLPFSIIMMDVNGLKLINDAFGHAMGDLTLQRVAAILKKECRSDDIIARFGGDEFVILLPGTNAKAAEKMVNRIYLAFEKEILDSINISVSCGWATKLDEKESITSVFKLAEDYMYRRKLSESQSMHYKTIDTILQALHGKSEREKNHAERVGVLCEAIAVAMKLNPENIKEFRTIGLMHDIGKIAIDLSILEKPDHLNELERAEIERHPEMGYQILRSINDFAKLAEFTLAHHEKWDGTGYPRKLKGKEIPLESRIIAIADAYDSMTSDRAYRKALSREIAIKEIKAQAGTQFDPEIAKIFVEKVLKVIW